MKKTCSGSLIVGALGMLIIIFDGKTAVSGVQSGLQLCLQTLIPSLFPFFVLSPLITGSLMGSPLQFLRPVGKLCGMPEGTESLFAVGLLGGYPLGAGMVGQEFRRGNLSKPDAQRMSIFCNNAGPSFLFGVLRPFFPSVKWIWLLWGIQIAASILTGLLLSGGANQTAASVETTQVSLSDSMNRGIKSMAMVCGWVIFFRMILAYLDGLLLHRTSSVVQTLLTGLLELSNGCLMLSGIGNLSLRFVLAGIMLSAGGVCVWMQTKSLFPELSLSCYIAGRLLHCILVVTLSVPVIAYLTADWSYLLFAGGLFLVSFLIFRAIVLLKPKKEVAFYKSMLYNSQ